MEEDGEAVVRIEEIGLDPNRRLQMFPRRRTVALARLTDTLLILLNGGLRVESGDFGHIHHRRILSAARIEKEGRVALGSSCVRQQHHQEKCQRCFGKHSSGYIEEQGKRSMINSWGKIRRRRLRRFKKKKLVSRSAGQWVTGQVHLTWDKGQLTFDS